MPMLLIKGSYKTVGVSPGGDCVRFSPDDPDQWDLPRGRRVRRNRMVSSADTVGEFPYDFC